MARYISRPKSSGWIEDETYSPDSNRPDLPQVSDDEPQNTGLLNANGDTIWRLANPVGFGRMDEWD